MVIYYSFEAHRNIYIAERIVMNDALWNPKTENVVTLPNDFRQEGYRGKDRWDAIHDIEISCVDKDSFLNVTLLIGKTVVAKREGHGNVFFTEFDKRNPILCGKWTSYQLHITGNQNRKVQVTFTRVLFSRDKSRPDSSYNNEVEISLGDETCLIKKDGKLTMWKIDKVIGDCNERLFAE